LLLAMVVLLPAGKNTVIALLRQQYGPSGRFSMRRCGVHYGLKD
jgi:hypothetical protein